MDVRVGAKLQDLFLVLLNKGTSYLFGALLFAMMIHKLSPLQFGNFGYWWSIALAVGGIFFGGIASAALREFSISGDFSGLKKPFVKIVVGAFLLAGICWAAGTQFSLAIRGQTELLSFAIVLGVFIQLYLTLLLLIRVHLSVTSTALPTIFGFLSVLGSSALTLHWGRTDERSLLLALICGYFFAFLVALLVWLKSQSKAVVKGTSDPQSLQLLFWGFTLVNIFSYSAVNADFTLFKLHASDLEFAHFSALKIFFERYSLPLLVLLNGAFSMSLIRNPDRYHGETQFHFSFKKVYLRLSILFWFGSGVAFVVWRAVQLKAWLWEDLGLALIASAAYLVFSFNGLLFDILVMRKGGKNPITCVSQIFIFFLIWMGILYFKPQDLIWACSWLVFNVAVFVQLKKSSGVIFQLGGV